MNFKELRNLIIEFYNAGHSPEFIMNAHPEILKFRKFLASATYTHSQEEISGRQLYELAKILISDEVKNSNVDFVRNIKNQYDNNHFLTIFAMLRQHGLITREGVDRFYKSSFSESKLIFNLFCIPKDERLEISSELLDLVILFAWNEQWAITRIEQLLKLLHKSKLLNSYMIKFLSANTEHIISIENYFSVCGGARDFNPEWTFLLERIDTDKVPSLLQLLATLKKASFVLDDKLFERIIKLDTKVKWNTCNNIFSYLNFNAIYISKHELNTVLTMSETNLSRLETLVKSLAKRKLLDESTFKNAFQLVVAKLEKVNSATVIHLNSQDTNASEYILDGAIHYYTKEDLPQESGGFGVVKRGHSDPACTNIVYAIKALNQNGEDGKEEAIKEVKYNRLLNRQSFFYTSGNRNFRVVSEWQKGKCLHDYTKSEILQLSQIERLQCILMLLTELKELHVRYRVHGDIKNENVILDTQNKTAHLVDFGGCHKIDTAKSYAHTEVYSDGHSDFSSDIYAMGIVAASFFPELYDVKFDYGSNKVDIANVDKPSLSVITEAIVALVISMTKSDCHERCSVEDAIQFCQATVNANINMTYGQLFALTDSTLEREHSTVLDVIRRLGK